MTDRPTIPPLVDLAQRATTAAEWARLVQRDRDAGRNRPNSVASLKAVLADLERALAGAKHMLASEAKTIKEEE